MDQPAADKARLRWHFGRERQRVAATASRLRWGRLGDRLGALLGKVRPRVLVAYEALGSEIDPAAVVDTIRSGGVPVYLPNWEAGAHEFVDPETGRRLVDDDSRVVILVPGLAFDVWGARLGRGAGWYDRMLAGFPQARRVGVAFEEQITDRLPSDPWDVPMHHVVSDARSITVDGSDDPAGECAHEWT